MYRMKDALASTIIEESFGLGFAEWGFMPHDFYFMNIRLSAALSHPDDVRSMHMSTMNRKNRYVEHYIDRVGDKQHSMRVPLWYQINCQRATVKKISNSKISFIGEFLLYSRL
jgi:hypothetical protein